MKSAIALGFAILATIIFAAVSIAQDKSAPAAVPSTLPSHWEEIDQRFVFFTVQLASTETSLDAVNKALKLAGYHQTAQQKQAAVYQKNNEDMDRNGGGPVRWDRFYGKTAEQFYHATDFAVGAGASNTSLAYAAAGHTEMIDRPPQFDYIYRANQDAQQHAEDDVAKLGGQIDALVERRKQLETEQTACWAKIAFQGVASRKLDSKPIYRFTMKVDGNDDLSKQRQTSLRAAADFVRVSLRAVSDAQDVVEKDPAATFDALNHVVATASDDFNGKVLHCSKLALDAGDATTSLGRVDASIGRLADVTKNIADSYHKAIEGDQANDDAQKQTFRAYTQQALFNCAANVVATAQYVMTLGREWNAEVDVENPLPAMQPTEVAKVTASSNVAKSSAVAGSAGTENSTAAAGSTAASAGSPTPKGVIKLGRTLPLFLTASGTFAADNEGIHPAHNTTISTRAGDFLDKDFIFDVYVTVPKTDAWIIVGVGDNTDKGSIRIVIRNGGGRGRGAFLALCNQWGECFGDIHDGEQYVIRLERHGEPITASVGSMVNGQFSAEMSQTVADPKTMAADLSEKRAHLFFAGDDVPFNQVQLLTGAAASASDPGAKPNSPTTAGAAADGSAAAPASATVVANQDAANGIYHLTSDQLPAIFTASGTFNITPAGLAPFDKCVVTTREEDFLSKDFIFEATVDVPEKLNRGQCIIGLGDATDKGSIRLMVRGDNRPQAFLAMGDEWGKRFGDLHEAGTHILRLERHGSAITASVGTETDGKFSAEMAQTVTNVKSGVPDLSERYAHLFFLGSGVWSKIRLVSGLAATEEEAPTIAPTTAPSTTNPTIPKPRRRKK